MQLLLTGRHGTLQLQGEPLGPLELRALLAGAALQLLPGQFRLLGAKSLTAIFQLRHGLHQMLDTGGFRIAQPRRLRGRLAPALPVRLPGVHGLFVAAKIQTGLGRLRLLTGELRLQGLELGGQLSQATLLRVQMRPGAPQALLLGGEVFPLLLALPAQVLNDFFTPGDGGLGVENAPIDLVEGVGHRRLIAAPLLEIRLHPPLLGETGLQGRLLGRDGLALAPILGIQAPPAQRQQLGLEVALLLLEHLVLFGHGGLTFEVCQALAKLLAQIPKPFQIFPRTAHAAFGFPAALLVFGDPGRFLEKFSELFRACLDEA